MPLGEKVENKVKSGFLLFKGDRMYHFR